MPYMAGLTTRIKTTISHLRRDCRGCHGHGFNNAVSITLTAGYTQHVLAVPSALCPSPLELARLQILQHCVIHSIKFLLDLVKPVSGPDARFLLLSADREDRGWAIVFLMCCIPLTLTIFVRSFEEPEQGMGLVIIGFRGGLCQSSQAPCPAGGG